MKIKKFIVCVACLLLSGFVSNATVSIAMQDGAGVQLSDESTYVPAGALVLLVWSQNASYETPISGSVPTSAGAFGSDYVLWAGYGNIDGGFDYDLDGTTDYENIAVGGSNIDSGYVYMYLFQDGIPQVGDYYVRSLMVNPLTDVTPASGPRPPDDICNISPDAGPAILNTYTVQPVPEPSSIALLGLGLGLVALRRKMRK